MPEHKDETVDVLAVVETVGPINEVGERLTLNSELMIIFAGKMVPSTFV